MESILSNSPTSKVYSKIKFQELFKSYRIAIIFSIIFLIFALNQNFFLGEYKDILRLGSFLSAGLTGALFMTKVNKIQDMSRKLSDEAVLALIKILSNHSEYVEDDKAIYNRHALVAIIRSILNDQISKILKEGSFTTDKKNTDDISLEGIEDLRSTKNKLSFLLYELGISTRDQEGFQWKQNNQK
ncbi:hypothetical protein [Acinetobacter baumannii]|uniref:hypothetical protein n=1 Tax=Acinetobacter baumannii TaxID=470 RepID=UPI001964D12C|nr:hypothetical protein [Acinetobacter baumannii]QRY90591.1 hypothetical protein JWB56_19325 [Acinetobacter baumannii]